MIFLVVCWVDGLLTSSCILACIFAFFCRLLGIDYDILYLILFGLVNYIGFTVFLLQTDAGRKMKGVLLGE